MADGLFADIASGVEHLIEHAAQDMFGTGGSGARPAGGAAPTGSVDSIRWEGMTNAQLATAVRQLNTGPGQSGIQQAADALSTVAGNLRQIDNTLHTQLQAIGINWQSNAGELAQEMTTAAAAYSGSAGDAAGANSQGVTAQGDAFAAAKNAVPHPSTLQGPANTFLAGGGTLTGHETDQAQQVARTNQARQQAIDTMTGYTSSSQAGLSAHRPAPPPHTYTVAAHPGGAGGGVTSVSGFTPAPPSVGVPGGVGGGVGGGVPGVGPGGLPPGLPGVGTPTSGVLPGVPGQSGFGGEPGLPGVPGVGGGAAGGVPGGVPGFPGLPGIGGGAAGGVGGGAAGGVPGGVPGVPGGGVPGGGVPGGGVPGGGVPGGGVPGGAPTAPLAPGPVSGIGAPGTAAAVPAPAAAQAAAGATGSFVEDAAIGSAIVGGTVGAGVGGASARPDELVRNRQFSAIEPEPAGEGDARSQAARALAELEGDEAEAGLTPGVLEPAVGAHPEHDATHSNRYAADDDVFGDGRMVVAPVLGDEPGDDAGEPE